MGFLNKFKKNNHQEVIKPTNVVPNKETKSIKEVEKDFEHRRTFEKRLSVIVNKMRDAKVLEEEILKYIDEQRAIYIEERNMSEEDLISKRKSQFDNSRAKSERIELKNILEIYFQEDIEESEKFQTAEELEKTKRGYAELIQRMIRMTEEELEAQYDRIDVARRIKCEKDNRNKIFKECLEKEVVKKLKEGTLKQNEIPDFRKDRIKNYLNGTFDYSEEERTREINRIKIESIDRPSASLKIIDTENLPKIRERIKWIKAKMYLDK